MIRRDGRVERVEATGPLIGVTPEVRYVAATVLLSPGDTIFFYTDGLTDAQAPSAILADAELCELLAAAHGRGPTELAALMERAVTGAEQPRDDIAMLVIQAVG